MLRTRFVLQHITKYIVPYTAALFLACSLLVYPFFTLDRPGVPHYQLHGFKHTQKNFDITVSWNKDKKCEDYTVIVKKGWKRKLYTTKKAHWKIKGVYPGEEYRVIVMGRRPWQGMSDAKAMNLKAVREYQEFETADGIRAGFKGDKTSVRTKAVGKVTYRSLTPENADVSKTGVVTFKKAGDVQIQICAAGTELYRETKETINMKVFPKKLPTPENLRITDADGDSVTFAWDKAEYAGKYRLYKEKYFNSESYIPVTKESEKLTAKVIRDGGNYKVKSINSVNGDSVESPQSDPVFVSPASESAKAKKSLSTIETLGTNNTKKITSLPNNGYALQSMCVTDNGYIVTYAGRRNKGGKIYRFDFDGKSKKQVSTGNIGHGNGTTYNPENDSIYIAESAANHRSSKIARFKNDNLSRMSDIDVGFNPSAIAYDRYNGCYYLKTGRQITLCDSNFKDFGEIKLKRNNIPQDIGAYNGLVFVCTWSGGITSYIDVYRANDRAYIGSYRVALGELESCGVKDGKLVFTVNNGSSDGLYITKKKIGL